MALQEERQAQVTPVMAVPGQIVADPAPLGLAGFALTTFLLSVVNAGYAKGTAWVGPALFYGGLAQFMAGMQEFKNRNVFGATAFSTYGGFWMGLFAYLEFGLKFGPGPHDIGWYLLAFAVFNTYMLVWSTKVNVAVFAVFLTLEVTEVLLFLGNFANQAAGSGLTKLGGIIGILTAAVAWYTSAAGVINNMAGKPIVSVGKPMW